MSPAPNDDADVLEATPTPPAGLTPGAAAGDARAGTNRPPVDATPVIDVEFSIDSSFGPWDQPRREERAAGKTMTWQGGFPPPDDSDEEEGRPALVVDFGKYDLLGEIGRGGMGVVYKARQRDLDRTVAIKMILASHLASPEQVERFYAEARAAARVQHPHIVTIHEVGQIHGQHYFAMEFVAGSNLTRLLKLGPMAAETAARQVLAVALAVEHLHTQGIVHRDLKPSNILLDEAGHPYVSDFGLAKMLSADSNMTNTGAIVGTPSYMAPEQAAGRSAEVGPRSDIYSLGAILYELITGRPPFACENPMETLVQVLEGEPPRPSQLRPNVPRPLEAICLKCLEKDPGHRYASAAALVADLERFLRGEPVEARREGPWLRLRRWARREPALASRLGTLALCGSIIQANHYLLGDPGSEPPRGPVTVVLVWALASLAFQGLLRRERWSGLIRYAWSWADVILFTALVLLNDVLQTSLVAGYFLLVAASGLWFRERLVWFTTVMAVTAYGALVLNATWHSHADPDLPSYGYRHVVFAAALGVSGLIIAYQVKRVRALSHYYEQRPLP